jgi:hypothetical protein
METLLETRQSQHKGRSLFTTRHVRAGEVVLKEAPLLLAATREYQESVCACCLKSLPSPGPPSWRRRADPAASPNARA